MNKYVESIMESVSRVKLAGRIAIFYTNNKEFCDSASAWLKMHGLNVVLITNYNDLKQKFEDSDANFRNEIDVVVVPSFDSEEVLKYEEFLFSLGLDNVVTFINKTSYTHRKRMLDYKDIHLGETAYILGNGPSVKSEDLDKLEGKLVFAANRFYLGYVQTKIRPSYTAIADILMIEQNGMEILQKCETPVFIQTRGARHLNVNTIENQNIIEYDIIPRPKGVFPQVAFSNDLTKGLGNGASIIYDLIQIAVWMGVKKIFLYGMDHTFNMPQNYNNKTGSSVVESGEKNHFIQNYRQKGEKWYSPVTELIEKGFSVAREHCEENGVEIYNVTRGGKLEIFERVNFDDSLKMNRLCVVLEINSLVEEYFNDIEKSVNIYILAPKSIQKDLEKTYKNRFNIIEIFSYENNGEKFNIKINDKELISKLKERRFDKAVIPFKLDTKEIQFIPNEFMPEISHFYILTTFLYKALIRKVELCDNKTNFLLKTPMIVEDFINKHQGQRAFVVGNGPSLNKIDMTKLRNELTFGANRVYLGFEKWGYDFNYWAIVDRLQLEEHLDEWKTKISDKTVKFFPFEYAPILNFQKNYAYMNFLYDYPDYIKNPKFDADPFNQYLGFTVTHTLLQLATIMGCNPIYLIGVDHNYGNVDEKEKAAKKYSEEQVALGRDPKEIGESQEYLNKKIWTSSETNESTHFDPSYNDPKAGRRFIIPKPEKAERAFENTRKWAEDRGIHIYNATPSSKLDVFEKINFEDINFDQKLSNSSNKRKNICVIGRNPVNAYSGGRYHAWGLAEAIAQNHNLIYFTNAKPMFSDDFKGYESHDKIDLRVIDGSFYNLKCKEEIDIIFFIPGMDKDNTFYKNTIKFASEKKAHLVLINFESPNWFNKYSVIQRDYKLWDNWVMMSKFSSCILSISKEGITYAKDFYKSLPKDSFFDYCYPTINSKVADRVYLDNSIKKENRIIMTVRFSLSEHKGSYNIPQLFCKEMRGYTFVLILGSGDVPKNIKKEIEEKANEYGVAMEYKHTLNDYQKFVEIKRAKVLLFPSFFEGFGYPPVEAQYMDTACVAFRIPVVEETSPNIDFVKLGDWIGFKETIAKVLQRESKKYREDIITIASFDSMVKKIDEVITKVSKLSVPIELGDISSIKIPPRNSVKHDKPIHIKEIGIDKVKTSSWLKERVKNVFGEASYVKMRYDYHDYKIGKIGFMGLNVRFFSNMVLKKIISDKSYNKLKNIYHIFKG